eukprot:2781498-Rhodomonas_salina.2
MLGTVVENDPTTGRPQSSPSRGGEEVVAFNAPPSPRVERRDTPSELSEIETLRKQLRSFELRAERAEQTLQNERRRQSRASMASMGSVEGSPWTYAKPKLAPPWVFLGQYSVLSNVLNWLHTVEKYLDQTRTSPEDWMGYARTYVGPKVQAWFDSTFWDDPHPVWEEVKDKMIDQYLPIDHPDQVEMKFECTVQCRGLAEYVEQFQNIDVAIKLADVNISDSRKVRQFVRGLREKEDKRSVLERQPKDLKEAYAVVSRIRQAKILCNCYLGGTTANQARDSGPGLKRLTKIKDAKHRTRDSPTSQKG